MIVKDQGERISNEQYERICDWYAGKVDQLCELRPEDAGIYRSALAHYRSARPQKLDEVRMRAMSMIHTLSTWGEMMMPEQDLQEEIEEILEPAPTE